MPFSDEMLMAFADGELPAADMAAISDAIAQDPALGARIERIRAVRLALRTAFDPVAHEPVPEALRAILDARDAATPAPAAPVIDLAEARARKSFIPPIWAALAACLVVGVIAGRYVMPASNDLFVSQADGLRAAPGLARVLDGQLAGERSGAAQIGFSFHAQDGRLCRTFAGRGDESGVAGFACRDDAGWSVEVAASAPPQSGEYRQADANAPVVLEAVDAVIVGAPLDAEGERAARANGWREKAP